MISKIKSFISAERRLEDGEKSRRTLKDRVVDFLYRRLKPYWGRLETEWNRTPVPPKVVARFHRYADNFFGQGSYRLFQKTSRVVKGKRIRLPVTPNMLSGGPLDAESLEKCIHRPFPDGSVV